MLTNKGNINLGLFTAKIELDFKSADEGSAQYMLNMFSDLLEPYGTIVKAEVTYTDPPEFRVEETKHDPLGLDTPEELQKLEDS